MSSYSFSEALHTLIRTRLLPGKKRVLNISITVAGIGLVVAYSVCAEACRILQGYVLGVDLKYVGFLYAGGLVLLSVLRLDLPFLFILAVGIGAEVFLLGYQVMRGQYCYFCLSFAAGVTLLFALNFKAAYKVFGKAFLGIITFSGLVLLVLLFEGPPATTDERGAFLPSFGTGRIEIRVYTDYYCEQCSVLEPQLRPVISELVRRNAARVTFITTSPESLYAKYYLYILKARGDLDNALSARAQLFEALKRGVTGKQSLERFLGESGLPFQEFDVKPTVRLIMRWIDEDRISGTPCCVIQDEGKKMYLGTTNIMNALAALR